MQLNCRNYFSQSLSGNEYLLFPNQTIEPGNKGSIAAIGGYIARILSLVEFYWIYLADVFILLLNT